jgi:hypothetical protein
MSNKAKSMVAWKIIFWSLSIFYIIALLIIFYGLLGPIVNIDINSEIEQSVHGLDTGRADTTTGYLTLNIPWIAIFRA